VTTFRFVYSDFKNGAVKKLPLQSPVGCSVRARGIQTELSHVSAVVFSGLQRTSSFPDLRRALTCLLRARDLGTAFVLACAVGQLIGRLFSHRIDKFPACSVEESGGVVRPGKEGAVTPAHWHASGGGTVGL